MRKKFDMLVVVLMALGFGLVGFAQTEPDGSVPYPSLEKGAEPEPQVVWCGWEYRYDQLTPWEFAYAIYRCNRTHRCSFFIDKGCYHVNFYRALFDVYGRRCCYYWGSKWCGDWVYVGMWWRTREGAREFLGCGCTGVKPDQSGCEWR